MEFLNEPVQIESLPKAEEVPLQPIEQSYLKVLRIIWGISVLVLLTGGVISIVLIKKLHSPPGIIIIGGGWLLLTVTWYFFQQKSFHTKAYAIRDKDVIYRSGWIIQHTYTCPFNRIQNTTVTIGPLERKFGLATLILYTAGADDADLQIPGLQETTARTLKEWITKKVADEPANNL